MKNSDNLIHSYNSVGNCEGNFKGLTKREYFAIMALSSVDTNGGFIQRIAEDAVRLADALLEELDKNKE